MAAAGGIMLGAFSSHGGDRATERLAGCRRSRRPSLLARADRLSDAGDHCRMLLLNRRQERRGAARLRLTAACVRLGRRRSGLAGALPSVSARLDVLLTCRHNLPISEGIGMVDPVTVRSRRRESGDKESRVRAASPGGPRRDRRPSDCPASGEAPAAVLRAVSGVRCDRGGNASPAIYRDRSVVRLPEASSVERERLVGAGA